VNADEARNAGIEFDIRKNLGFASSKLERFNVYGNYTFVDSEITIPREQLNVLTTLQRPLSGQSRHVVNAIFEFDHPGTRSVARMLVNYQGERITDVGALGLPDIIQSGYPRLDAIYIQKLGEKWGLKFSALNLLDQRHEFTQGGELQRAFKTGRSFSIGISYNFFGEGWTGMAGPQQSGP
jgi:outer membrane receptor protein involved in Fe transport